MPTLDWIGKKAVINHHREVPFHLLKTDEKLSVGEPGNGNLLIEGDNLLALKALLPYYAGKVKCIYIDPPYNTGNENWVYNDAVNSPEMKDWLGNIVGGELEDLSRHDKWLCMMYPRLCLLKDFLSDDGVIFINIDDNEFAYLRCIMDEIFGPRNFLASIAWEKRYTRSNNAKLFYSLKDIILAYRKSAMLKLLRERRTEKSDATYKNPDNDERGAWMTSSYVNPATKEQRPNLVYPIINPFTQRQVKHPTHAWKYEKAQHEIHVNENLIWWGRKGDAKFPRLKVFLSNFKEGLVPIDLWKYEDTGTTDDGGNELKAIFGKTVFDNPKPKSLLIRILSLASNKDSIILDAFAGSGTTGHAVLDMNKADGGKRRFILVEMEKEICQNVTSQRLRRAIEGYSHNKADGRNIEVEGLGGGFRYTRLGPTLFDETGAIRSEVSFWDLAAHVYFTETGEPLSFGVRRLDAALHSRGSTRGEKGPSQASAEGKRSQATALQSGVKPPHSKSPLIGVHNGVAVYLLYNGILGDKRANGGNVLTQNVLKGLPPHDGPKVIYGTGCRLGTARLKREGIVFKQIPYAIKVS